MSKVHDNPLKAEMEHIHKYLQGSWVSIGTFYSINAMYEHHKLELLYPIFKSTDRNLAVIVSLSDNWSPSKEHHIQAVHSCEYSSIGRNT